MEKLTKKQLKKELTSHEFIQYLWSSMTPQEIDETRLQKRDGWFISYRKIHRNTDIEKIWNIIIFEDTDERNDFRNALYWHWNIGRLELKCGDTFFKHNEFIIIQAKKDFCTIIYRLID